MSGGGCAQTLVSWPPSEREGAVRYWGSLRGGTLFLARPGAAAGEPRAGRPRRARGAKSGDKAAAEAAGAEGGALQVEAVRLAGCRWAPCRAGARGAAARRVAHTLDCRMSWCSLAMGMLITRYGWNRH
jgi:hypothetical protein